MEKIAALLLERTTIEKECRGGGKKTIPATVQVLKAATRSESPLRHNKVATGRFKRIDCGSFSSGYVVLTLNLMRRCAARYSL